MAREEVTIDLDDRDSLNRILGYMGLSGKDAGIQLRAALRHAVVPRCVAHGNEECRWCSRIRFDDVEVENGGVQCSHCSTYGTTGMHWDTCRGRIRGIVYANRAEATASCVSGLGD